MDRRTLERHLAEAEKHIAIGQTNIARQQEIIAGLERDSHDPTLARKLLASFEELQRVQLQERDTVVRELLRLEDGRSG
jgi:hypothetical protein